MNNHTGTAYEVFNPVTGITIALVRTESEALAYPGTDYAPVRVSPCYCDSAFHPQGHAF